MNETVSVSDAETVLVRVAETVGEASETDSVSVTVGTETVPVTDWVLVKEAVGKTPLEVTTRLVTDSDSTSEALWVAAGEDVVPVAKIDSVRSGTSVETLADRAGALVDWAGALDVSSAAFEVWAGALVAGVEDSASEVDRSGRLVGNPAVVLGAAEVVAAWLSVSCTGSADAVVVGAALVVVWVPSKSVTMPTTPPADVVDEVALVSGAEVGSGVVSTDDVASALVDAASVVVVQRWR